MIILSYEFKMGRQLQNKFFVLFGLMLYVHGQQMRSCRDGQLAFAH